MRSGAGVMAHTFKPSIQGDRDSDLFEFEGSMVYTTNSKPVRTTW